MAMSYFDAGYRAYLQGRKLSDNEYSTGSNAWLEWRRGWNEAKFDAM